MHTNSSKAVLVVAAVIRNARDKDKILIVRRGPGQSGAGSWEFPGGKVDLGETPEAALVREIDEELGIQITVGDFVGELDFAYPTKVIRLRVYLTITENDKIDLREHDAMKWCRLEEIIVDELSPADRPFIPMLADKINFGMNF